MEVLELAVYTLVAVIVGATILGMTYGYGQRDPATSQHQIRMTETAFYEFVVATWHDCALGTVPMEKVAYIEGDGMLTRDEAMQTIIRLNAEQDLPEHMVVMSDIATPAVATISCSNEGIEVTA